MLTDQQLYNAFYGTLSKLGHSNEHLDAKTDGLIGLAAAYAMNCAPCSAYSLKQPQKSDVTQGELQEVLVKVMAISAGQKHLQAAGLYSRYKIETSTDDMSN